ncbi:MAG: TolB family protein [Planctomycetota bacterium]|jgi:hypothetical protein
MVGPPLRASLPFALLALALLTGCHDDPDYDLRTQPKLALLDASPTTATIGWEGAYPNARRLRLERREEGKEKFKNISGDLAAGTTQYADPELEESRNYFYRLRAFFKGGGRARSVILGVLAEEREEAGQPLLLRPRADFGEVPYLLTVAGEPRLSPDGATLAWVEDGQVLLLDTASGDTESLATRPTGPARGVAWTPDGLALVVAAGPPDEVSLLLLPLDSERARLIGSPGEGGLDPDVSPDGARVVFVRDEGVAEIDLTTGIVALLVPGSASKPRWSPDGRSLAYLFEAAESIEVRIASRDSGGSLGAAIGVATGASGAGPLVWSGDGERLAFIGEGSAILLADVFADPKGGDR